MLIRESLKNGNYPSPGNVTEEKESELEDFIEYSVMVLGVLGYKIFVPILEKEKARSTTKEDDGLTLYLSRKLRKSNRKIEAKCVRTNEGFVVLKGSMIDIIDSETIPKSIKELREKNRQNGEISGGKITKDCLFNSPSYASTYVLGMPSNGRTDWKTKEGITLKELEDDEIKS